MRSCARLYAALVRSACFRQGSADFRFHCRCHWSAGRLPFCMDGEGIMHVRMHMCMRSFAGRLLQAHQQAQRAIGMKDAQKHMSRAILRKTLRSTSKYSTLVNFVVASPTRSACFRHGSADFGFHCHCHWSQDGCPFEWIEKESYMPACTCVCAVSVAGYFKHTSKHSEQ